MSSFNELRVVHHPEAAKVVLIADKALVQGQVRADGILAEGRTKKTKVRRRGARKIERKKGKKDKLVGTMSHKFRLKGRVA